MKETVLNIRGLTKKYGKTYAINNLDLQIEKGNVFGLLGPNGSGKTTTLGIVLGAINQTSGSFNWFGKPNSASVRKRIGAILEQPSFYHYLSAFDNLKVVCAIREIDEKRIDEVLDRVDLLNRKNDPFKTYSLGMKQRLAIASALIADPEVMILDEPTNGLDPQGIAEIRELIIELGKENRTIILASHLLDEVQKVCNEFAVLKFGEKLYQGNVNDLETDNLTIELASSSLADLDSVLQRIPMVLSQRHQSGNILVQLKEGSSVETFHTELLKHDIILSLLRPQTNNLERKFLEILKAENHA